MQAATGPDRPVTNGSWHLEVKASFAFRRNERNWSMMRRPLTLLSLLVISVPVPASAAQNATSVATATARNCATLNVRYPHGVGRPGATTRPRAPRDRSRTSPAIKPGTLRTNRWTVTTTGSPAKSTRTRWWARTVHAAQWHRLSAPLKQRPSGGVAPLLFRGERAAVSAQPANPVHLTAPGTESSESCTGASRRSVQFTSQPGTRR